MMKPIALLLSRDAEASVSGSGGRSQLLYIALKAVLLTALTGSTAIYLSC